MTRRVLILGGTAEARALAAALEGDPTVLVTSSLAGRVAAPHLPAGRSRVGGFGGVEGLVAWLRQERIDVLIDATHPFAATMTTSAAAAAQQTGIPLLRLSRPPWHAGAGDRWHLVESVAAAARLLSGFGKRVFLTTGRLQLAEFAPLDELWFLVRSIDPPAPPVPTAMELILARGPFTEAAERELMQRHRIDALVTKNSGGEATAPKLRAARSLGLPVVLVDRPPPPADVTTVDSVAAVLHWLG